MKLIARILMSALLMTPLVGCQDERGDNKTVFQVDPSNPGPRYGYPGDRPPNPPRQERRDVTSNPTQDPANEPPVDPVAETGVPGAEPGPGAGAPEVGPQPNPDPGPGSATPPPSTGSPPFAKQVPGKTGFVYSPFLPGKQINAVGYPPGTILKCPYTDKEFKVP